MNWKLISTAPKDGSWIALWRGPAEIGRRAPFIFGKWSVEYKTFIFPVKIVDIFHELEVAEEELLKDFYDDDSFSHWSELPESPK